MRFGRWWQRGAGVVVVGVMIVAGPGLPADAAGSTDGAPPIASAAAVAPSAVVLGSYGSSGPAAAVNLSDVDGVASATFRLVDPTGHVTSIAGSLVGGNSAQGRWGIARQPLTVRAATGTWRFDVVACDTGATCATVVVGHVQVRRNAVIARATATPRRVVAGHGSTLSGRLLVMRTTGRAAPLRTNLDVQFRRAGGVSWSQVRIVRTNADGVAKVALTPRTTGSWRLHYRGSSTYRSRDGSASSIDVSATSTRVFGHSVRGRALIVHRVGDPNAATRVLVFGSIHGNEKAGLRVVSRLRATAPAKGVVFYLVPTLNPDGTKANTRQNAHGVDLNRNFAKRWRHQGHRGTTYYSGPHARSEPETRAAEALIRSLSPTLTVWYHQHMNLIDPAAGSRAVANVYGKASGMRVHRLEAYHGSASTWQGSVWHDHVVLIVELPAHVSAAKVRRHARAVRTTSLA